MLQVDALREWLAENFVGCTAPLFEAAGLLVTTFDYHRRKTLKRHHDFDRLMIEKVERGLQQPSWQGFVYVMHWNCGDVSPLYVGKTERCGRKRAVSTNIENIRSNDGYFGRWGYSRYYHIGDLSHAMFGGRDEGMFNSDYRRWADRLFSSDEPPRLRQKVSVALIDWFEGKHGPLRLPLSVRDAEKEIIKLAKRLDPKLLNFRWTR
jgi:hypothetical protein